MKFLTAIGVILASIALWVSGKYILRRLQILLFGSRNRTTATHCDYLLLPEVVRIHNYSLEEAHEQVERLLDGPGKFIVEMTLGRNQIIVTHLSAHIRNLFERFDTIRSADGQYSVGPAFLHEHLSGRIIEIGGSEDAGVFVQSCDERIFEGSATDIENIQVVAPTIYHWLLMVNSFQQDD
jgi:hypothetical protein